MLLRKLENTLKFSRVLVNVKCKKHETKIVSNNTIRAETIGTFITFLGKNAAKAAKNLAIKVATFPTRALRLAVDLSTVVANRDLTATAASALF